MDALGTLIPVFVLLLIGWLAGRSSELRHLRSLERRESNNGDFLVTQLKSFPALSIENAPPQMVVAETIIATDYLKTFLANLRGIFGGEVHSYHSLLARARRETTQRLVQQAQSLGHNAICNLRLVTADVGGSTASRKGAAMVAILGSATAYTYRPSGPDN